MHRNVTPGVSLELLERSMAFLIQCLRLSGHCVVSGRYNTRRNATSSSQWVQLVGQLSTTGAGEEQPCSHQAELEGKEAVGTPAADPRDIAEGENAQHICLTCEEVLTCEVLPR